ncbi:MAG: hypothetical protein WAK27_15045 [Candidatus Sulfotelmatobacter sp.]
MTIGVGFRCDMGIVVCSDTQITWKDRHKAYESKLFYLSGTNWTMASVYAGDPQLWKSFRDKFKELIKGEVSDTKELRDILETAICYFSELETDPMALSLLMGFVIPGKEIRLVKTEGRLVSDVNIFDYIGCGDSSLLRYLTPITADNRRWPTVSEALYLGTYWVHQAKRWVEDCGGDTDAFVLLWGGGMQNRSDHTYNWEQHLARLERNLSDIITTLGAKEISDDDFEKRLETFCKYIREERLLLTRHSGI